MFFLNPVFFLIICTLHSFLFCPVDLLVCFYLSVILIAISAFHFAHFLPVCVSVYLSVYIFIYLSISSFLCRFICLYEYLFICIYPSFHRLIYSCIHPSVSIHGHHSTLVRYCHAISPSIYLHINLHNRSLSHSPPPPDVRCVFTRYETVLLLVSLPVSHILSPFHLSHITLFTYTSPPPHFLLLGYISTHSYPLTLHHSIPVC